MPNGVLWEFITPPLPPHSIQDFMQLLDFAPVPLHLSQVSNRTTFTSRWLPNTDSSKLKERSYLKKQQTNQTAVMKPPNLFLGYKFYL